jgi:hypothetical protein
VPAKSAREIASITEYWYISRLTVAATVCTRFPR